MEVTRVPDEDGIHHVLLTRCVLKTTKTKTKTRCIFEKHKDKDKDQVHF